MSSVEEYFKGLVVQAFRESLEQRVSVMQAGAALATEGAQGEDSKAEGKYDTRAIEASYLAQGQSDLIAELKDALDMSYKLNWKDPRDRVSNGACVEATRGGEDLYFLIVPKGGGESLNVEGLEIQTLSESAPLAELLGGARVGDFVDDDLLILDVI